MGALFQRLASDGWLKEGVNLCSLSGAVCFVFQRSRRGGAPLKVDYGFDAEQTLADGFARNRKRKFNLLENADPSGFDQADRHRAWLRRGPGSKPATWRPQEMHRVAARKWLQALDNQISVSTGLPGLSFFVFDEAGADWAEESWSSWPALGLAMDLGSDGVAGANALMWHFGANAWIWADPAHSAQRSFDMALKQCGLMDFWMLCLITWNMEFGPYLDESRRNQLECCMNQLYTCAAPHEVPLYETLAPHIIEEVERSSVMLFPREKDVGLECWEWLATRPRRPVSGRRTSMSRFGGSYSAAKKSLPFWSTMLFERSYLSLEAGFLKGRAFTEKVTVKQPLADSAPASDALAPTATRGLPLEDKSLRQCCQNAVVISMLTLEDSHHHRAVRSIVEVTNVLDAWHTTQSRLLRSVSETQSWVIGQVSGDFMSHVCNFLQLTLDRQALSSAGFVFPTARGQDLKKQLPNFDMEQLLEDEAADMFGQLCLSFVVQRISRGLPMYLSWPHKMLQAVTSDALASEAIEDFRRDQAIFNKLKAKPGKTAAERLIERRHLFNLRSVKQLEVGFKQTGFAMSDPMRDLLISRARGNVQTQIIEDLNGEEKNSSQLKNCRRFRKPARCMALVLEKEVITKRHRFKGVALDAPLPMRDARLPKDAFKPDPKKGSLPFGEVASSSATPSWHSPGATNLGASAADISMLRWLDENSSLDKVDQAWLGEACDFDHRLILGLAAADGEFEWHLALRHFQKSAVLLWPVRMMCVDGSNARFLELDMHLKAPVMRPLVDISSDKLRAVTGQWRSWLWQVATFPRQSKAWSTGIRMFVGDSGDSSFAELACKCGWWSMSRTSIAAFAKELHVPVEPGANLFELLWATISHTLGSDDEETLSLCHLRVARSARQTGHSEAILEVEEATELLDKYDADKLKEAQKSAAADINAKNDYKAAYYRKATQVNSVAKKKKARRGKAAEPLTVPHHIDQTSAKKYMPASCSVWRDLSRGGWCAHPEGFPRLSESFSRNGGSHGAFVALLKRVWTLHLEQHGKSAEDCPIAGLFEGTCSSGST